MPVSDRAAPVTGAGADGAAVECQRQVSSSGIRDCEGDCGTYVCFLRIEMGGGSVGWLR